MILINMSIDEGVKRYSSTIYFARIVNQSRKVRRELEDRLSMYDEKMPLASCYCIDIKTSNISLADFSIMVLDVQLSCSTSSVHSIKSSSVTCFSSKKNNQH